MPSKYDTVFRMIKNAACSTAPFLWLGGGGGGQNKTKQNKKKHPTKQNTMQQNK